MQLAAHAKKSTQHVGHTRFFVARPSRCSRKYCTRCAIRTIRACRPGPNTAIDRKALAAGRPVLAAYWERGDVSIAEYPGPRAITESLGVDGAWSVATSASEATGTELASSTNATIEGGVFGVASVFVGDEGFWGKGRFDFREDELRRVTAPTSAAAPNCVPAGSISIAWACCRRLARVSRGAHEVVTRVSRRSRLAEPRPRRSEGWTL